MLESVSLLSQSGFQALWVTAKELLLSFSFNLLHSHVSCLHVFTHLQFYLQSVWAWMFSPYRLTLWDVQWLLGMRMHVRCTLACPFLFRAAAQIMETAICREWDFSQSCFALYIYSLHLFAGCRIKIRGFLTKSVGCQLLRTENYPSSKSTAEDSTTLADQLNHKMWLESVGNPQNVSSQSAEPALPPTINC